MWQFLAPIAVIGLVILPASTALAQSPDHYQPATEATLPATLRPTPRDIIQLKAMARAEQRARRMSALDWYGVQNSRPLVQATPFTSSYPVLCWDLPLQRPYAHYEALKRPFEYSVLGDVIGPPRPGRDAERVDAWYR